MAASASTPVARRRGGVQPDGLSQERIVVVALDLVREQGLPAVTIARVASALGVTSPALYHHLPGGKQELLDLLVRQVVSQVHSDELVERPGESWQDTVERFLLTSGRMETEYPGVMHLILTTAVDSPGATAGADFVVRQFLRGGLSPRAAAQAYAATHAFTAGWASSRRSSASAARRHGHTALGDALDLVGQSGDEEELRFGLRALLAGLVATTRPEEGDPAPGG